MDPMDPEDFNLEEALRTGRRKILQEALGNNPGDSTPGDIDYDR